MQHTLKTATDWIKGVGLHTGMPSAVRLLPAAPGTGLLFVRTDLSALNTYVPAKYDAVDMESSRLCTMLKNSTGVVVQTPEHLMSALYAMGIDNALIELTAPEVPLMDGTARPFAEAIQSTGRKAQPSPRAVLRVLKPVRVGDDDRFAMLTPGDKGLSLDFTISFPGLGTQRRRVALTDSDSFMSNLADARTFTLRSTALQMKEAGAVKGGSLDNALVLNDEDGTPVEGTMRYADEPVRHKIMDAIGDLALGGYPIVGAFQSARGGHALTNALVRALLADSSAYEIVHEIAGIPVSSRAGQTAAAI